MALTRTTPCDLLVVDEIGPLELERRGGWENAFDVLRGRDFALALVVVRPELVIKAQLRLPDCATVVLTVTRENRDQLPGTLMGVLGEER
jgi:nucleoside-triphosphatase THEP1